MKVFLSHNSKDKDFALDISYKLIDQGIDVWLDKWEIYAGESLTDKISHGIREVNVFIIVISPNSMKSNWVKEELRMALNKRIQSPDFKIIPILFKKCEVHEFIKDYVYIDWTRNKTECFSELIKSIKKINIKPQIISDYLSPQVEFQKIDYYVRIGGKLGDEAEFTEKFKAVALKDIKVIDRSLHSEGNITKIKVKGMKIERNKPSSYLEKWKFIPRKKIKKGDHFSYEIYYSLQNGFNIGNNFWDYAIQAPTDLLNVEFEFLIPIKDFRILHRVGITLTQEPTKYYCTGNKYIWNKLVPVYKDTYEFHFKINKEKTK
jgi:hypothetical protein